MPARAARAGGATVKPDDFYRLYALHMQVRRDGTAGREGPGHWAQRAARCGSLARTAIASRAHTGQGLVRRQRSIPSARRLGHGHAHADRASQATQGDNTAERPMWAERGGLDFEGRSVGWAAWGVGAVRAAPDWTTAVGSRDQDPAAGFLSGSLDARTAVI